MVSAGDRHGEEADLEQQIVAARSGSAPALGALLDQFRNYLLLIANAELDSHLRKKIGASDLVQETFVDAQQAFAAFQGATGQELRAWLRQIVLNRCRNLRVAFDTDKRDIGREIPLEANSSVAGPALIADAQSPSAEAMAVEEAMLVARAVARLPQDYQEVVRLRNWEDLTFVEIGTRMGRSAESVRKLWSRAIDFLGIEWEKESRESGTEWST